MKHTPVDTKELNPPAHVSRHPRTKTRRHPLAHSALLGSIYGMTIGAILVGIAACLSTPKATTEISLWMTMVLINFFLGGIVGAIVGGIAATVWQGGKMLYRSERQAFLRRGEVKHNSRR